MWIPRTGLTPCRRVASAAASRSAITRWRMHGNWRAVILRRSARERGLSAYADDAQVYLEEQFNVIRGLGLVGKLFDVGIQIAPGFVHGYEGVAQ